MRKTASLLLLVIANGCTEASAPGSTFETRDSLGITIIGSPELELSTLPGWTLAPTPTLEIGGESEDPGHQLNQVVSAFRFGDGRIVVGDGGSREVRFFDANGRHTLSVGGPGGGPGEFSRQLRALARLPGDTLAASDWPFGTLTRFTSQGEMIGQETIGPFLPGFVSRILDDGAILQDVYENQSGIEWWAATSEESLFRSPGHVIRLTRDAPSPDTIRHFLAEEWFKIGQSGAGLVARSRPFGHATLLTASSDWLFVADTGSPQVEVWSHDGRLVRLLRWAARPAEVTAADERAIREEVLGAQPQRRADFQRWLAEVPFPESKPPIRALTAEPDGHLWVGLPGEIDSPTDDWLVFSPDGAPLANATLPKGLVPLEIGTDYVLGVWKDPLDREYVRLYTLDRTVGG